MGNAPFADRNPLAERMKDRAAPLVPQRMSLFRRFMIWLRESVMRRVKTLVDLN
jgi:hypothetical protein